MRGKGERASEGMEGKESERAIGGGRARPREHGGLPTDSDPTKWWRAVHHAPSVDSRPCLARDALSRPARHRPSPPPQKFPIPPPPLPRRRKSLFFGVRQSRVIGRKLIRQSRAIGRKLNRSLDKKWKNAGIACFKNINSKKCCKAYEQPLQPLAHPDASCLRFASASQSMGQDGEIYLWSVSA